LKKGIILLLSILALLVSSCGISGDANTTNTDLRTVRLPMGFIPNVQYAPFYVAVEKGYFAEIGVEIEFDYSFETDGVALVGAGELPFAIVSGEQVLLAREQEIPVVYVAAWFQDYPVALIAKTESGIERAEDLAGRNIGLPGLFGANYVGLRAMLNAAGIGESELQLDSIGFNQVEALAADQEDAIVGYINNEPVQLQNLGYEVNIIPVSEYVHLAANGIISNEETIAGDAKFLRDFVKAFIRGLEDAIVSPDEAFEISKKYVDTLAEADASLQKEILALSIELWETEELGLTDEAAWQNMQEVLLSMGLLNTPLNLANAYSNAFLPSR
jgi:NitT/TauT family transport system substrate-binding protein